MVVSVTVGEPDVLVASSTSVQATCNEANGSINLTVLGGTAPYSYQWSNGQTTATAVGLSAGTYVVTVTDGLGCEAVQTVQIDEPTLLVVEEVSVEGVSCAGGSDGSGLLGAIVFLSGFGLKMNPLTPESRKINMYVNFTYKRFLVLSSIF